MDTMNLEKDISPPDSEPEQAEFERLLNSAHEDRSANIVTYEEAIKATGYGKFHVVVLLLCGWAVSSDAIEVLCVSFMLPSAEHDLGLSSNDKGWLNSIIFLGMMVGGYLWGSLADSYGRRAVLLGSLTVNGLGGLASSVSQVFWLFLLMRFISGVGVGGSIPVIFSYFTEFQPKDRRGMMISVLATFWMFGNIIAAGLAWIIIPHTTLGYFSTNFTFNSWRIFVAVCTIPSLSSALMFIPMPESPKFLLHVGKEAKAVSVLRRIYKVNNSTSDIREFKVTSILLTTDGSHTEHKPIHTREPRPSTLHKLCTSIRTLLSTTGQLFNPSLKKITIVTAVVHFTLSFGYYGLWMWFPELFNRVDKYGGSPCDVPKVQNSTVGHNSTLPDDWVYFSGFITALSNLPGNIFTIFLMDRLGRIPLLASSMVLSGISVFFIPFVRDRISNLAISSVFGAVSTVGWNALDVLESELFPTGVRSTAFGLLTGLSRIAAILGNLAFGELVDIHCAVPMILVSALLILGGLVAIKLPNTTKVDIH